MYLVPISRPGETIVVFTEADPKADGCPVPATAGGTLALEGGDLPGRRDGLDEPDRCVGRSPTDPADYRVFRAPPELFAAGYEPVPGSFRRHARWNEFVSENWIQP